MRKKCSSGTHGFTSALIQIFAGLLMMSVVFAFSAYSDIVNTEAHLSLTVRYIKEQADHCRRMWLASETKSLMHSLKDAHQIKDFILSQKSGEYTAELIRKAAENGYATGALIIDDSGNIIAQHHKQSVGQTLPKEVLQTKALLETAKYPEKSYTVRLESVLDDTHADVAAIGLGDGKHIIVTCYHSPPDYIDSYSQTISYLLSGYNAEENGTILIVSENEILVSTDETTVGHNITDYPILQKIRDSGSSDRLVSAVHEEGVVRRDFGLMEHGLEYYVYIFLPESDVFKYTPRNLTYAFVVYIILIIIFNTSRKISRQAHRESQLEKEYSRSLKTKNEQLQAAAKSADRANAAKTFFLSRMSHDIRTPLNGIIGIIEIDDAHPDDLRLITENRKKMKVTANHLLSLINDVLQMGKLESGGILLANERIDFTQLICDIQTIMEQRAAEAGVSLIFTPRSYPAPISWVYGSPLHLRQIFVNIFSNCIKYNKVGGKVETLCECLELTESTVTYRWRIQDTGIGMNAEFLKHIFDPFAQESTDAQSVFNGTGLGMVIVKELVDRMGGKIEVTSEVNVGSVFEVTLPFGIAPKPELPAGGAALTGRRSMAGLSILLVEDNSLNSDIASVLLKDRGVKVTAARDGRQAVKLFEESPPNTFDAILMDLMMPVMDGYSAARAIRALRRADAASVPIIAMTANAYDEDIKRCLDAGMNAHLAKPLDMNKLAEVLTRLCGCNS